MTQPKPRLTWLWYIGVWALSAFIMPFWLMVMNRDLRQLGQPSHATVPIGIAFACLVVEVVGLLATPIFAPGATFDQWVLLLRVLIAAGIIEIVAIYWAAIVLNRAALRAVGATPKITDDLVVVLLTVLFFASLPLVQIRVNRAIRQNTGV